MIFLMPVPTLDRPSYKYWDFKVMWRSQRDLSSTLEALVLSQLKLLISFCNVFVFYSLTLCSHLQTTANPRKPKHTTGPKKDRLLERNFIDPKFGSRSILSLITQKIYINDYIVEVHNEMV